MDSILQRINFFLFFMITGVIAFGIFVNYSIYRRNEKKLNSYANSQMVKPSKVRFALAWFLYCLTTYIPAVLVMWLYEKEFPQAFAGVMLLMLLFLAPSAYPYYIIAVSDNKINGATRWGWLWERTEILVDDVDKNRITRQRLGKKLGVTVIHAKNGTKIQTLGLDEKQLAGVLDTVNKSELTAS